MKDVNIIQNLGFEQIPKYGLGSWISRILNTPILDLKKQTINEDDYVNIPSLHTGAQKKDTKKASTSSKKSDTSSKKSSVSSKKSDSTETTNLNSPETTTATPQTITATTNGYMDWMTEYFGDTSNNSTKEPFNSQKTVWEDPTLGKIDTRIVGRYLKYDLQSLLDAYNAKLAESIGQKRS